MGAVRLPEYVENGFDSLGELRWTFGSDIVRSYVVDFVLPDKNSRALIIAAVANFIGIYRYEGEAVTVLAASFRHSEVATKNADGSVKITINLASGGFYEPTYNAYGYALI